MKRIVPKLIIGSIFIFRIIFHFSTNIHQAGGQNELPFFIMSMIPYSIVLVFSFFFEKYMKVIVAAVLIIAFDIWATWNISGEGAFMVMVLPIWDTFFIIPTGFLLGWIIEKLFGSRIYSNKSVERDRA